MNVWVTITSNFLIATMMIPQGTQPLMKGHWGIAMPQGEL
jgi:hypothetical protein